MGLFLLVHLVFLFYHRGLGRATGRWVDNFRNSGQNMVASTPYFHETMGHGMGQSFWGPDYYLVWMNAVFGGIHVQPNQIIYGRQMVFD